MQSCEIALIPQNFLLGEMFCCGALLTLRSPRTPFLDRFNCRGSCINDRYSRLALYMAVLCLGQVGPLTNDREQQT
jgi:hypothetical protein